MDTLARAIKRFAATRTLGKLELRGEEKRVCNLAVDARLLTRAASHGITRLLLPVGLGRRSPHIGTTDSSHR